jgi:hypothetical protein
MTVLCHFRFPDSSKLKVHIVETHTRDKPFACGFGCGHAVNNPSNRSKHERQRHGMTWAEHKKRIAAAQEEAERLAEAAQGSASLS